MPKGAFSHKGHTIAGETKHLVSPLARLILAKMRSGRVSRRRTSGHKVTGHKVTGHKVVTRAGVLSGMVKKLVSRTRKVVGSRRVGSRKVAHRRRRHVGSRAVGSRAVGSRRVGSRRVGSRRVGSRASRHVGSRRVRGSRAVGSRRLRLHEIGSRRPELGPFVPTGSQRMLIARLHKNRHATHAVSAPQFGGRCTKLSGCVRLRNNGFRRRNFRNYGAEGKSVSNAVGRLALGFAVRHPRVTRRSLKGPGRAFRGGKRTLLKSTVNKTAQVVTDLANYPLEVTRKLVGGRRVHRRSHRRVMRGGDCVGAPLSYSMSANSQ